MIKNEQDYADAQRRLKKAQGRAARRLASVSKGIFVGVAGALFLCGLAFLKPERNSQTFRQFPRLLGWTTQAREGVRAAFGSVQEVFTTQATYRRRLRELEQTLLDYEQRMKQMERLQEENTYLRQLLPMTEEASLKTLTVVRTPLPTDPFLVAAVGSFGGGDYLDHVVFSPQGFLGTVVAQHQDHLVILLATHVQSRIPVISAQSHKQAILFGNQSATFSIRYVRNADVSPSAPFAEDLQASADLVDGELLHFQSPRTGQLIPVAKVVRQGTTVSAEWIVKKKTKYLTVLMDEE